MDLDYAEAQGSFFAEALGCPASGEDVLDCIYGKSTFEIVEKTPSSWNYGGGSSIPTFPGDRPLLTGLVIVDGVTVTKVCILCTPLSSFIVMLP